MLVLVKICLLPFIITHIQSFGKPKIVINGFTSRNIKNHHILPPPSFSVQKFWSQISFDFLSGCIFAYLYLFLFLITQKQCFVKHKIVENWSSSKNIDNYYSRSLSWWTKNSRKMSLAPEILRSTENKLFHHPGPTETLIFSGDYWSSYANLYSSLLRISLLENKK